MNMKVRHSREADVVEVSVDSHGDERSGRWPASRQARPTVEELARRKGVRPIKSLDDLARDDVWESDEELDAFLAHLDAMRHTDLA
jgi:hypothetical protein